MLRRFGVMVLLPGIVLLLFGLRALDQDRRWLDLQIHNRMENGAALAARAIDQQLANWQQLRADGVTLAGNPVKLGPEQRSAYEVGDETPVETPVPALGEAERREFRGDLDKAISLYRAAAANPNLRAKALLRLGETYNKAGQRDLAAEAFQELLRLPEKQIGSGTVELVARFELCEMGRGDRAAFYHDLVAGRWRLDKPRYLFYSEASRGWTPESDPAHRLEGEKLAVSAAVENYLENRRRVLGGDFVAFWNGEEALILVAAEVRQKLEQAAVVDSELKIQLADAGAARPPLSATHYLSDRDLPWIVEATPADPARLYAGADQRRAVYLAMLLLVFLVLAAGSYVTAQAVNREIEVARLKSEFVSTVSHEFRSPLTAIGQLAELLQRGRVADEQKRQEYYGLICRESSRLSRLVENLLDFSRLEEGRKQFYFERVEVGEWLRELASSFGGAHVSLSVPAGLPAIEGDRLALTSAVQNLLDNAVKYSPPESPVTLQAEANAARLTIRVRDQGYGIAEEDRSHVFEKFYRGNGEISRRVKGAGVGLSLVRQIVEAHGGQVDFDTRLGQGSEFRIRLKTV